MGKNTIGRITAAAGLFILSSMTAPSASAADVGVMSCVTDTTYLATAKSTGWLPTDVFDNVKTTPNGWYIGSFHNYNTNFLYDGSTAISPSAVVAAANGNYGGIYSQASNVYINWEWSKTLSYPGVEARLLVLHRADKITFNKYQNNSNCTTTTTTGLVAYIPLTSDSQSTYCSIVDIKPYRTSWSSTCVD